MAAARYYRRFAGPGLLFFISVLFHWKLVLTNQYTWLEAGDIGSLIMPWFQFQAGEWHHWRFPLWDPNSWAGQPLFGQAQPGAAYPLNWLLFWMPLHNGWLRQDVLHWFYVLVHYLAGLTAYALCRDLGRSRLASVLGGVIYSLAGYVASTDWPQMLHGAIWAPLVFLYLFRVERGERPLPSAALAGFFLGLTWLAGHHQMQIFLALAVAGIWVMLRAWRLALISFAIAAMTGAFQTLPTAEYGRLAVRWVGTDQPQGLHETVPYTVHIQYAMKPMSLIGIFVAGVDHGPYNAFVGVAAFSLGILGALLAWRERRVRWLGAVALGGILFALGSNSVFHGVIYSIAPLVDKARVPAAGTLLFAIGIAPLAAFGLDALRESGSGWMARRASWILAAFGAVLALGGLLFYAARVPVAISDNRIFVTALCALLAAALLAACRTGAISARLGAAAAIGLVLFEVGNVTDYNLATADRTTHPYLYQLAAHSDLAAYVKGQPESARIFYDGATIPYNIGDWYGIEAFNAYAASVPASLWQLQVFAPRVEDILGIRYFFGDAHRADVHEVFEGKSGVKIFENGKAFPRVWAVHRGQQIASAQVGTTLADPKFDARHEVFLVDQTPPKMEACENDEVWMPHHEPNKVTIKAAMNCRGMVVLTDNWFPGWTAAVDGKSVKIEKAYGAFRGVMVEAGEHTIVMRYRPWSVYIGGLLTLAGACIALWMGRRGPKRQLAGHLSHLMR